MSTHNIAIHSRSNNKYPGSEPFEFAITRGGIAPKARAAAVTSPFVSVIGRQPVPHG